MAEEPSKSQREEEDDMCRALGRMTAARRFPDRPGRFLDDYDYSDGFAVHGEDEDIVATGNEDEEDDDE